MKKIIIISQIFLYLFAISSFASNTPYQITTEAIMTHISVLANDSLEGRQVGEAGEKKAALYIENQFKAAGLLPGGENGTYYQEYEFTKNIVPGEHNTLSVKNRELIIDTDYFPLKQSASTSFEFDEVIDVDYGIKMAEDDGHYNDYENKDVAGKAVLIRTQTPENPDNPHMDFSKYESMTDKINTAIDQNAAGIFFITPDDRDDTLKISITGSVYPKEIPIIFIKRNALEKLGLDPVKPQFTDVTGETEMIRSKGISQNVIGIVPGKNDTTVIVGAHYDHLGWGYYNSLYTGEEKMIHNGADDNGSGTSALLELAKYFESIKGELNYSILFIAFGGEEFGLLGSGNFAKHMTIDSSKVRMMINMDMIGRLKDQDKGLAILGTGTCEAFKNYFDSLDAGDLKLALKESGSGPSDHTPFYNRKIPVLHFFTGAHMDYHKPSDDIEFIDGDGIVTVSNLVGQIITHFDQTKEPLVFQKTKDSGEGKRRAKYSVTLGVMPDYVAEVKGLKIDGVVDGRPGAKAGLVEGDTIIRMGEITINDIYDYMNALGKFRKGDSITIDVIRNADTLTLPVVFE